MTSQEKDYERQQLTIHGKQFYTTWPRAYHLVLVLSGTIDTMSKKTENAASVLRLGLLSTLIRHENGACPKRELFKPDEFENAFFVLYFGRKIFWKQSFSKRMMPR